VSQSWRDAKSVFTHPLRELHQAWTRFSGRIAALRDNPAAPTPEHARRRPLRLTLAASEMELRSCAGLCGAVS